MYPHKNDSLQFFFSPKNNSIFQRSLRASVAAVVVAAYDCFGDLRTTSFVFFLRFTVYSIPLHVGVRFVRWVMFHPTPPTPRNKTVAVATILWAYPLNKLEQTLEAIVLSTSTLNTYPNSSLSSFLVASKGTFRTSILELFCFVAVADLRCDTLSLKMK